jgi:hypothetical protein
LPNRKPECDLEHDGPRVAVVRVEVKSTRASRPGHPMVRTAALCTAHARQLRAHGSCDRGAVTPSSSHARQLRELGIEIVEA